MIKVINSMITTGLKKSIFCHSSPVAFKKGLAGNKGGRCICGEEGMWESKKIFKCIFGWLFYILFHFKVSWVFFFNVLSVSYTLVCGGWERVGVANSNPSPHPWVSLLLQKVHRDFKGKQILTARRKCHHRRKFWKGLYFSRTHVF